MRAFPSIIWHLDDLRMPMPFGSWQISRQTSAHNPVILSGMGGDELFGGYLDRVAALPGHEATDAVWLSAYGELWARRMLSAEEREHALTPISSKSELRSGPRDALYDQFSWAQSRHSQGPIRRLLALEQSFYLPGLLIVDDRMSMAHGVETRVPLIDYRLADIAETVPEDFLVRNGLGKFLLRQAVKGRVPHSVSTQPKLPFRVPESTWYRKDLAAWVVTSLLDKRSMIHAFVNVAFIERVIREHCTGIRNRRHVIWSLLSFEYWCRAFLAAAPYGDEEDVWKT